MGRAGATRCENVPTGNRRRQGDGSSEQSRPLVVAVGASPRAAVESLRRAGFRCVAVARYVDEDLRRLAESVVGVSSWRQALDWTADRSPERLVFVGPLENRPAVVRRLSRRCRLWGVDADALRAVRSPWRVARALHDKVPCPALRPFCSPPEPDGSWLLKPLAGAGGVGVRVWDGGPVSCRQFFQRLVPGLPVSAVFVADGTHAALVGLTQQLVGLPTPCRASSEPLGRSFVYVGSFGPLGVGPLPDRPSATAVCEPSGESETDRPSGKPASGWPPVGQTSVHNEDAARGRSRAAASAVALPSTDHLPWTAFEQAERAGQAVTAAFQLRGLFGCDFVWDGRRLWLVEVNPRYTASVEVFERAAGVALLRWHASLCEGGTLRDVLKLDVSERRVCTRRTARQTDVTTPNGPARGVRGAGGAVRSAAAQCRPDGGPGWLAWSVLARCERRVLKRVLYAAEPLVSGVELSGRLQSPHTPDQFERRWLADVPPAGSRVGAGEPVCTVLVEEATLQRCVESLQDKVQTLQADLGGLLL